MRILLSILCLSIQFAAVADECTRVLEMPARFAMNNTSGTIAVGDFDLDGRPDVAFPYAGSQKVAFFWNRDGGLTAGPELTLAGAFIIEATDVNRDGRTEVLVLGTNSVTVVFAEGNGQFRTVVSSVPSGMLDLPYQGDFTGDGVLDLLARSGSEYRAFQGDTTGRFTQVGSALSFPARPGLGDVDGDGKADAWLISSGTLAFHKSNGDGTFAAAQTLATNAATTSWAGDFDGDRRTDFLSYSAIYLSSKSHAGAPYQPLSGSQVVVDVNGDGRSDLAAAMALDLSRGDGTFERVPLPYAHQSAVFAAADLNLDGHRDLISTSNLTPGLRMDAIVRYGRGGNRYEGGHTLLAGAIRTADMNGDGITDLVTGEGDQFVVHLGQPDHTLRRLAPVPGHGGPVLIGDFTSDGKPDVITTQHKFLAARGDGTFGPPTQLPSIGTAAADMNNDGKLDMVGPRDGALGQWLGDGKGGFTFSTLTGAMAITDVRVGRFDADAIPDVVALADNSASQSLHLIPGAAPATAVKLWDGVYNRESFRVSDLDGDGAGEIIVQTSTGDELLLFRGYGNGAVALPERLPIMPRARALVAVGNFGGDARADLVVSASNEPTTIVFIQQPDGSFRERDRLDTGFLVQNHAADLDGDGASELLLNYQNGITPIHPTRCAQELIAFAPEVRLTQSSELSAPGRAYTFTAEVSEPSAGGTVTFRVVHPSQIMVLGTAPVINGRASLTLTPQARGTITVFAIYNGYGRHARSESNRVTHTVGDVPPPARRRSARH